MSSESFFKDKMSKAGSICTRTQVPQGPQPAVQPRCAWCTTLSVVGSYFPFGRINLRKDKGPVPYLYISFGSAVMNVDLVVLGCESLEGGLCLKCGGVISSFGPITMRTDMELLLRSLVASPLIILVPR